MPYHLEYKRSADSTWTVNSTTLTAANFPRTISGLTPGFTYNVRCRAEDASGNLGAYSATSSATTQALDPQTLLSMANQSLVEGNSGTTNMVFPLIRAADGFGPISYSYLTIAGTATAGVDFAHVSGTGTITSGQTVNISVPIIGDTTVESNETFTLRVTSVAFV